MKNYVKYLSFSLLFMQITVSKAYAENAMQQLSASELLTVLQAKEQYNAGITELTAIMRQSNPMLNDYIDTLEKWVKQYISWDALEPKITAIYAEEFTDDEIQTLIKFFRTDVGKKFINKQNSLMQKITKIANETANANQEKLYEMIHQQNQK